MKILIVGAGIGGRALVRGLEAAGSDHGVEIVERRSPERQNIDGSVITVDPNGFSALQSLDASAYHLIRAAGFGASNFELIDGKDGSLLTTQRQASQSTLEAQFDYPRLVVPREAILRHLEPTSTDIKFGKEFAGLSEEFSSVDLIVGADGMHSTVRPLVSDDSIRFRGVVSDGGELPLNSCSSRIQAFVREHPLFMAVRGANALFVTVNSACRSIVWSLAYPSEDATAGGAEADERKLGALVEDWQDRLREIVSLPTTRPTRAYFDRDPIKAYHRDNVVLLGDAAHPMTPYQGQGANMALEDAAVLVRLLTKTRSREELPAVLERYSSVRAKRTAEFQLRSRQGMNLFHLKSRIGWAWRSALFFALRHMVSDPTQKRNQGLYAWRIDDLEL